MKKLVVALCAVVMGITAANAGECIWSWWTNAPEENASKNVTGCALGIASEVASIQGAQVTVFFGLTEEVKSGAQVSIGYNRATTLRNGAQVGFFNRSDAAALQIGLLNFNKSGFLPFFPFFNFSVKQFGPAR